MLCAVFALQGFSQNIPPLIAGNGRCACLCINWAAVNLPFNRRGSRAGNYFWTSKCADKEEEKQNTEQRGSHVCRSKSHVACWPHISIQSSIQVWPMRDELDNAHYLKIQDARFLDITHIILFGPWNLYSYSDVYWS